MRLLRKGVIGTTHFLAHVALMFGLGLAFVQFNNLAAPPIHAYANSLWATTARDTTTVTGSVARKVLDPLSEDRQRQRSVFEAERQMAGSSPSRSPPPLRTTPSGANELDPKAIRQIVGFAFYPFQMILLGGFAGGFIWGLYWVLTGLFFRMHAEDAFGALRNPHYRNFLRMKFERDRLTIYPIGLDRLPDRDDWMPARKLKARKVPSGNPHLVPRTEIPVRLIEDPIIIERPART
jgi:hypothetical protein